MEPVLPVAIVLLVIPIVILSLVQLVCLVMVIVKMFQHNETWLAIACVVLSFCTGIGGLIAFVYGWMKAGPWGLQKVMLAWTICFVLNLMLLIGVAMAGAFAVPVNIQPAPAAPQAQGM